MAIFAGEGGHRNKVLSLVRWGWGCWGGGLALVDALARRMGPKCKNNCGDILALRWHWYWY